MDRAEAIKRLDDTFEAWERWNPHNDSPSSKLSEALGIAIAALREQYRPSRNELAELLEAAEGQVNNDSPSLEQIADYLIAHGVVLRRRGE